MSNTAYTNCPECGEEVTVEWWTEDHKINIGVGMQTVARDHHREVSDPCGCELTDDQIEELFEDAAQSWEDQKADYGDYKYDQMKDEGRL